MSTYSGSGGTGPSRTMRASEFKAKCRGLIDDVAERGGEIVITKNGKPVSKLTAFHERPSRSSASTKGAWKLPATSSPPIEVEWEAQADPGRVLNP